MSTLIILICLIIQELEELNKWEKLCKKVDNYHKLVKAQLDFRIAPAVSHHPHNHNQLPRLLPKLSVLPIGKPPTKVLLKLLFPNQLNALRDHNGVYPDKPTLQIEASSIQNTCSRLELMAITQGPSLITSMLKLKPIFMT